jgi:hypothetical protein
MGCEEVRIPRKHVNSSLRILKTNGDSQYIPLDARTLLKTTRGKPVFKSVPPGHYHHVRTEPVLISFLKGLKSKGRRIPKEIRLFMNVDGILLTNSSSSEFWPILFRVLGNFPSLTIVYCTPYNNIFLIRFRL